MARRKQTTPPSEKLFAESQMDMFEKSYEERLAEERNQPVKCLGMTFPNDEERRKYFLEKLREKLNDPEFRKIDGFPIGDDEDILALSDPPYYTACPNPFIDEFIRHYGKPYDSDEPYSRKPFAIDVSEGKTHQLYRAHSYHTKVPHLAIVPSILHYTNPGDIVLDGFCGSGMTGVAAQWCGTAPMSYQQELEARWDKEGLGKPKWGFRRAILNDLSPAATFIASNYSLPFAVDIFENAGRKILLEVEKEIGWMYKTLHTDGKTIGQIEYTVWSEVFTCPECAGEVVFLEEALDAKTKRVKDVFPCPHCGIELTKRTLERLMESRIDPETKSPWKSVKFIPALIHYSVLGKKYEKKPDKEDLATLNRIENLPFPQELPSNRFPIEQMYHGSRIKPKGFTHIHHFFLPRAAQALAALWRKANTFPDMRIRHMLLFFVEQGIRGMSILNRYKPIAFGRIGGSQVGLDMPGVYYIASLSSEVSPWYQFGNKLKRLTKAFRDYRAVSGIAPVTTNSTAGLNLPDQSIDYIFTDPPFGENIYYADLNFMVESWHGILTNTAPEAIVDKPKKKSLFEYQRLMHRCFVEYFRVLKPGRWMTVVFHNSHNAVWNVIQEAMMSAGFVIADVRTLDKKQGSYRQVTSTTLKQDLVISAYKPNGGLESRFKLAGGTEKGVWDFVRTHLKQLPVFVTRTGKAEAIAERKDYFLFDRMVSYHVQRGVSVPLSATEFYQGLDQLFAQRDEMYFLPEQVTEYDKKRMSVHEILQLQLAVSDEKTALEWLRQQLTKKPQTFQELQPRFMELTRAGWIKHEKPIELSELLGQNFLCYDGKGKVPSQIHSYLSTNFKELRKLAKDDPALRSKAKNRWYVPDPNKASDLEKFRDRALLREFMDYLPEGYKPAVQTPEEPYLEGFEPKPEPVKRGKSLKVIRLEAVRVGFKHCWQQKDYRTIIAVAQRIPDKVLQEDPKLLMWYDQAITRTGTE